MLSYTSKDAIRKYFDADETLSPEQIDAVRTAWNTTITIITRLSHVPPLTVAHQIQTLGL